ncbi:MAG: ABC transporter ATP-binding protein/permease [Ruminococcus sp.]|nr:ABC transporter ATP-binding protein/permease [Ruminococcus sp.]
MRKKEKDDDKIVIKQRKGTWKRFLKLFPKCKLPWPLLIIYLILELGLVNVGVNETDYTAQLFAGDTSAAMLTKLIAVIVINLVGSNLTVFVRGVTGARINRNMRNVVYSKVMRLPMSHFKDENPRDAIYRITNNSVMIESTITVFLVPLMTALYKSVTVFGKVFTYDWRLSVILLAFIPIQIFIGFIFGRINFSLTEREASIKSSLTQKLAELITNIPLAKAFAKEQKETENGEQLTSRLYKITVKSSWLSQFQDLSTTAVDLIQSVIIVCVGFMLLKNAEITKRAWVAFFMFSSTFSGAVSEIMMYWNNVKIIQGGADKVAEIMDAPEEDFSGEPCENMTGSIKLENVHFGYDEDKPVLNGVSCEFEDNCVTALLGVSGCGKTTLINLLTRLYNPQEGEITVGEKSIHDYALNPYRNRFVMVSQNSMLFSGTVRDNVCYGNGEVNHEDLIEALKKAGAYDFVSKMPNGIDTELEEYANNISGGQKQRLAVARALLSDAHYLIFDEPAASMDAIATSELMDILKSVSKDKCMIVIAHTAAVLPLAQRVVVIENGVVTAQGNPNELEKTNDFLAEFMGRSVSV